MLKRNKKIVSCRIILFLAGLMLVFKGCGSEKREQTVNEQNAGISEQQEKARDEKLAILENERKLLREKMNKDRQAIQKLAQEYGTVDLSARRDLVLQRVRSLQDELTDIEAQRSLFEAKIKILEQKETKEAKEERNLAVLKSELEPLKESEKRMREMLAKENSEYIELARKQQTIDEYREKLKLTKEMYDMVGKRIQELEPTLHL